MATQGGDIRFTFTGDSSGLNSELKKIDKNLGEVSKATAGASNGLDKGLSKGARSADAAASKMTASIARAKAEMDKAAASASKMGQKMDSAADIAGTASSSLSSVGGAISEVNPAMGEMAGSAAMAAGALEGVIKVAKAHPVAAAAVAYATFIMGLAFAEATEKIERQEAALKKLDRRQNIHQKNLAKEEELFDRIQSEYDEQIGAQDEILQGYFDIELQLRQNEKRLQDDINLQIRSGEITACLLYTSPSPRD